MTAASLAGLPFALFVLALVVWYLCLLAGTLGSLDTGDESDENGGEG